MEAKQSCSHGGSSKRAAIIGEPDFSIENSGHRDLKLKTRYLPKLQDRCGNWEEDDIGLCWTHT